MRRSYQCNISLCPFLQTHLCSNELVHNFFLCLISCIFLAVQNCFPCKYKHQSSAQTFHAWVKGLYFVYFFIHIPLCTRIFTTILNLNIHGLLSLWINISCYGVLRRFRRFTYEPIYILMYFIICSFPDFPHPFTLLPSRYCASDF